MRERSRRRRRMGEDVEARRVSRVVGVFVPVAAGIGKLFAVKDVYAHVVVVLVCILVYRRSAEITNETARSNPI